MARLHELLAAEKSVVGASEKLVGETQAKFVKGELFRGQSTTLKMLEETDANKALEEQGRSEARLSTTVVETLRYVLGYWAKSEDVLLSKSLTNQKARADIEFRGSVLAKDVPVDELLGLESRLITIRRLADNIPTVPATVNVVAQEGDLDGIWRGPEEVTVKTEKTTVPVVLYEATEKHPAQVKEVGSDRVIGRYTTVKVYGGATSRQKADLIAMVDELMVEVKQARMRANCETVVEGHIGEDIANLLMSVFD